MPPGTFGGNMDTRQLTRARRSTCPSRSPGALFSCGDAHGGQGDGEVCVTGLEAPMYASLRFTLEKERTIPTPQYRTAGSLTPRSTTAAVRDDRRRRRPLRRRPGRRPRDGRRTSRSTYGLSPEDAYLLASLCVDLKISEIVDAGQYIVSALLPEMVFAGGAPV